MSAATKADWSGDTIVGMILPFALVVYAVPAILLQAWVVTKIWGWYIVPAFGFAPLAMIYAYGLTILVCLIRPGSYAEDDRNVMAKLSAPYLAPCFSFVIGWIGTFWL